MNLFCRMWMVSTVLCLSVVLSIQAKDVSGEVLEVQQEQETVGRLPRGIFCVDEAPKAVLSKGDQIEVLSREEVRCGLIIKHEFWKVRAIDGEGNPAGPIFFINNPDPTQFKNLSVPGKT